MKKILYIFLLVIFTASNAQAVLKIDINQGNFKPISIALPNLVANTAKGIRIGKNITSVIEGDLKNSGLFLPINKQAFIENVSYGFKKPRFADWRQINASALISGQVEILESGKIKVIFKLWDIYLSKEIAGKEYNTTIKNWRRVSHLIADEIYKRITGEDGYFDTRIVYISETGPAKKRIKRLAIMDQDGENNKFLSNGKYLVLTPRFSPNMQKIIYLSYASGRPNLRIRNLQTGRDKSLGSFNGMSFAPRFNHNGKKLVMSIAKNGNTEIYEMDIKTKQLSRLTHSLGIDTSPSYSPNGKYIVFNSDRGGSQQLYVMNADGSNVKRISFGDGRYGTPVWSPRQDLIVFTKMKGGRFHIGVMRPDGSGERILTQSWLDEGPEWSPNGRVIIFSRQKSPSSRMQINSIDLTGHNLRRVKTPTNASDPAWSPLLLF